MKNKIYKHCGSEFFDRNKFVDIRNKEGWVKPEGGLWASCVDDDYSWEQWVEGNDYRKDYYKSSHFLFKLNSDKILTITNHNQLFHLPQQRNDDANYLTNLTDWIFLDFEELKEKYDAIDVKISKDYELYHYLMGWDCDSILVLNPDVIEEVEELN